MGEFSAFGHTCLRCSRELVHELEHEGVPGPWWTCPRHGAHSRAQLERGRKWIMQTKAVGPVVVVTDIREVDRDRDVLASGLPVLTEECWDSLLRMPAAEAKRWLEVRKRGIDGERQLRKADPSRTCLYAGDAFATPADRAARAARRHASGEAAAGASHA